MRRTVTTLLATVTATAGIMVGAVAAGSPAATTAAAPATTTAAAPAAQQGAVATAATAAVNVRTIRYGTHARNVMDVYSPGSLAGKVGQKRGTVLLIHGGSWVKRDKSDFAPQARQLANRGYVVASMNYRYATQAPWPAQRTDGLAAVQYLRSHARSLNVDPARIVLIGSSAGAHIATSVATYRRGSDRVAGVIGLSGPLGMRRVAADPRGNLDVVVTEVLLRCEPTRCAARYDSATPKMHLSAGDVPVHLFSSRHEWLNPQNSVDFVRAAKAKGLDARMTWIDGDLHARYYWDAAWPAIRAWLAKRMA